MMVWAEYVSAVMIVAPVLAFHTLAFEMSTSRTGPDHTHLPSGYYLSMYVFGRLHA